jgi:hypothetical protein
VAGFFHFGNQFFWPDKKKPCNLYITPRTAQGMLNLDEIRTAVVAAVRAIKPAFDESTITTRKESGYQGYTVHLASENIMCASQPQAVSLVFWDRYWVWGDGGQVPASWIDAGLKLLNPQGLWVCGSSFDTKDKLTTALGSLRLEDNATYKAKLARQAEYVALLERVCKVAAEKAAESVLVGRVMNNMRDECRANGVQHMFKLVQSDQQLVKAITRAVNSWVENNLERSVETAVASERAAIGSTGMQACAGALERVMAALESRI